MKNETQQKYTTEPLVAAITQLQERTAEVKHLKEVIQKLLDSLSMKGSLMDAIIEA